MEIFKIFNYKREEGNVIVALIRAVGKRNITFTFDTFFLKGGFGERLEFSFRFRGSFLNVRIFCS